MRLLLRAAGFAVLLSIVPLGVGAPTAGAAGVGESPPTLSSDCAFVVTASFVRDGSTKVQGLQSGKIVDRPTVSKFDCASGEGVRTSNKSARIGSMSAEGTASASSQGFAYMGPGDNYFASDGNGTFSAQLTATTPSRPVIAFGYKLSAVHRAAAITPVTASVRWADNKTVPCHYGATHPANYFFHWSCLTKEGAKGYLNGPFSYRFSGGTATITISFTAYMKSWPEN